MTPIGTDSHVTLHYRVAVVVEGTERELVNTFHGAPATLQLGVGQWAPTVEGLLIGMREGERRSFELQPNEAYGERNDHLVRTMTRSAFEAEAVSGMDAGIGEAVEFETPGGEHLSGLLMQRDGDRVVVDFNHPLAGCRMRVSVHVIGVL
jgi:FKBP-type peptidyl-prolyl cis-trans isomerase SlpA